MEIAKLKIQVSTGGIVRNPIKTGKNEFINQFGGEFGFGAKKYEPFQTKE